MKKILRAFSSMRLALLLLGLVVLACVLGGLIPQGARPENYQALYGDTLGLLLQSMLLNQVFTAWWFIALIGLLMLNLCLCSVLRFPAVYRQFVSGFTLEKSLKNAKPAFAFDLPADQVLPFFARMGFSKPKAQTILGEDYVYQSRRRLGLWGSWLSHLGMLLIVVGFALGQMMHVDTSVYGVPGQKKKVDSQPFEVQINAFDILLREDNTVEQYIADLTVFNLEDGSSVTGQSKVNHPLHAYGHSFLQNATSWAANVDSYQGEERLDSRVLCAGESIELSSINPEYMDLALVFHALYPDYVMTRTGPMTNSPHLKNPAALFSLYYQGKLVDQNIAGMGFDIKVADYRFVLSNPQPYTLIQIVSDPSLPLVFLGGILMLLGLFLAFYLRPEEVWAKMSPGMDQVYGHTQRGSFLFSDKASLAIKELTKSK